MDVLRFKPHNLIGWHAEFFDKWTITQKKKKKVHVAKEIEENNPFKKWGEKPGGKQEDNFTFKSLIQWL